MDEWMDGWMDGWMKGSNETGLVCGRNPGLIDEWRIDWKKGLTDGWNN